MDNQKRILKQSRIPCRLAKCMCTLFYVIRASLSLSLSSIGLCSSFYRRLSPSLSLSHWLSGRTKYSCKTKPMEWTTNREKEQFQVILRLFHDEDSGAPGHLVLWRNLRQTLYPDFFVTITLMCGLIEHRKIPKPVNRLRVVPIFPQG